MKKLVLYYSPGACSLASHIALYEAGLEFELNRVDFKSKPYKTQDGKDLASVTAKDYVPVLITEHGTTLTEGGVILQYIADLRPEKHLAPRQGTQERYHLQEWLNYITSEVHKNFGPFFKKAPDAWLSVVGDNLNKRLSYIDHHLVKHTFLMGDHPTIADYYLFVCLNWAPMVKFDISSHRNIARWMEQVKALPSVVRAMKEEGLIH